MSVEPSFEHPTAEPREAASPPYWLRARPLWAGVSIITMWLVVLFVGLFGGDFVSSSSGAFTKIPVVIFLLPFVLPATIAVARRGFTSDGADRQSAADANKQATTQPSTFRTKTA
jgi:hypothetical protein